jgi:CheY-like chemotaxis protein
MRPILTRLAGEAITVELHLADGLPTVVVDPGQIEQVILNLAVNSRDAMPDGGELRIETALTELDDSYVRSHHGVAPGPHLRLTISDTGVGMDRETAGRIFEPFFTTKSAPKGTGLGLSTAYGIIKQSNGDIWVYSEPGEGTTFKIYLPIGTADDAVEHVARDPQLHASHGGETILVVEDEPELRRVVVRLLTEAGYRVMEAGSMIDALAVAAGQGAAIDLLLTDVMMPGGNGHQLAEALRATEPGRGTRVLYMSGYTDEAIVHHGVLDPGVDFISKPYTVVEIKAKVREVLDR